MPSALGKCRQKNRPVSSSRKRARTKAARRVYVTDAAGSRRSRRQQLAGESRWVTPGILPFALRASLRASLRLFKVAPGDFLSLHAGVASEAHEREKLERLCRYITRPAVSTERLSLTAQGNIRYRLKTPYRDGTTDVVFEPLDKIAGSDFEPP